MTSKELAKLACDALDDKKALEIKVINIENVSTCRLFHYRKRNKP